MTEVYEIHLPEYTIDTKPDYIVLGKKVDKILGEKLADGKYILRAIGSDEHEGLSIEELKDIILDKGTDRYDPKRKEVCHDEFCDYNHDLQAGVLEIKDSKVVIPREYRYQTEFGDIIYHFYEHTPLDRGHAVRIDLLIIYDASKLERAQKVRSERKDLREGLADYLYKFKNPQKKKEALLAILIIKK